MIVGYAGTSTKDQAAGLAAQKRDLTAAGAERIFGEQISSTAKRVKLAECLAFMCDGDVPAARPNCCPSKPTCRSAALA